MKNIAILYASSHGTTEKVAKLIGDKLNDNSVTFYNLKDKPVINLSDYEVIIIGCSIHAGQSQGVVRKFIKNNMLDLLQKKVALFLCCMNEPQEQTEFDTVYPELLRKHSFCNTIAGGEFVFERMNLIERMLIRKISGISASVSKIRTNEIDKLIEAVKSVYASKFSEI